MKMRWIRITIRIVLSIGACLSLAGCWDRRELNELAITAATAIDWEEGNWVVSYQVLIPSAISGAMTTTGGGAGKLPVIVYSTSGDTIREAVMRSSLESPRKLFFSHTRVVVIGEAAARHGLNELLDVYFRNSDSRETVSVLVTQGSGRKILNQLMQIQIIPGEGIEETIRYEARDYSALPNVKIYDLAMQIVSSSKGAVLPEILISGDQGVTNADELNKTALSSKLRLGRLAVLREDKLVGWLSRDDALGVAFLRNMVSSTSVSFACKPAEPVDTSTFMLEKSETKLSPQFKDGRYVMKVGIEAEGRIQETNCKINLTDPVTVQQMEEQLERKVEDLLRQSWKATRKIGVDVVGFADTVHSKNLGQWRRLKNQWPTVFSRIEIEPHVKISIRRIGLSDKSFSSLTGSGGGK